MLTTTKNTLLNKVLRLELDFSNIAKEPDIDFLEGKRRYKIMIIIFDNINSIKKQLKKL